MFVAVEGCRTSGDVAAGEPIDAHSLRPLPANRPQLVREVLLHQRNLRLHRELDVGQRRRVAAIGRDAGENPAGPLLIH